MLLKRLSQTLECLRRPSSTCRIVLPYTRPNTAGFKTKNPAKPDDTPIAATLDDVQHVGGQHSGNQQRGEQSNSTPYAQSEPASSKSNDSSIAFDRPPDSVTHTVHSDEGEYHSTTETPTWVSWTRISYLGSPSASEEIVHAERYPFDPLKAIREMHDWRGLGSGQSKGKQA